MPETNVKGFFLYFDQCEPLDELSDEQCGKLLRACIAKFQGKEYEITDPMVRMVFRFFEVNFRKEQSRYTEICEKRKESIKKRWGTKVSDSEKESASDTNDTNEYKSIQTNTNDTNEYKSIQTIPYPELKPELELKPDNKTPLTPQGGKSGGKQATGNSKAELQAQISAYTHDPQLSDALDAYRDMRDRIRKPLTGYALKLALKHLSEMSGDIQTQIAIVNQSVRNSWQDLYPLKGDAGTQQQPRARPGEFDMNRQRQIANQVLAEMEAEDALRQQAG